jgi:phosphatidylinositol 3-kinase
LGHLQATNTVSLSLRCCQVGWENPAELKAAKLARSVTRGVIDRDLKPNSDERRRIAAVLRLPPNKPLQAEAKALLWRFR